MKKILRLLQYLYTFYALILFIVLMLLVLPVTLFFSIFGKVRGGNCVYTVCNWWGRIWYFLIGVRHREIYEKPHNRKAQYIFVANHISYMDIPAVVRSMHQPVRVLGKKEMVSYPVFGWIYRMAVILVDRSDAEKRAQSVRALKAALQKHISIFIFPEGTFNETGKPLKEFFSGAFRIALETGTPIKPLLFLDTHSRLHYRGLFELTPGPSRVVYLEEIPVSDYGKDDVALLKEVVHTRMEKALLYYQGTDRYTRGS